MKLVRFGLAGGERPGILDQDGRVRDLSNSFLTSKGCADACRVGAP